MRNIRLSHEKWKWMNVCVCVSVCERVSDCNMRISIAWKSMIYHSWSSGTFINESTVTGSKLIDTLTCFLCKEKDNATIHWVKPNKTSNTKRRRRRKTHENMMYTIRDTVRSKHTKRKKKAEPQKNKTDRERTSNRNVQWIGGGKQGVRCIFSFNRTAFLWKKNGTIHVSR